MQAVTVHCLHTTVKTIYPVPSLSLYHTQGPAGGCSRPTATTTASAGSQQQTHKHISEAALPDCLGRNLLCVIIFIMEASITEQLLLSARLKAKGDTD